MDDKLRGRKVKEVIEEIVKDTMRMADNVRHVDGEGFYDWSYERLLDFVMDHGRTSVLYTQIERRSKQMWKQFIKREKKGATYFIDQLCRNHSEDNDEAFELIRERLLEHLEETDFDDMSKRNWDQLAARTANEYFWS